MMQSIAGMTLGLSTFAPPTFAMNSSTSSGQKKKVVCLFLQGGMTHMDSFDPKPQTPDLMGDTKVIRTNTGDQVSAYFPMLAQRMDKIALIRSMTSLEGDHGRGRYLMEPLPNIRKLELNPT